MSGLCSMATWIKMTQLGRLPFKLNDSWELCYSTTWNSSMDSHCSWNKVAIWNLVIANRLPALALLQEPCPSLFHSLPQLQTQAAKVGTREECFTPNNTPKLSPHTTHREPKDQDMTRTWMPESFPRSEGFSILEDPMLKPQPYFIMNEEVPKPTNWNLLHQHFCQLIHPPPTHVWPNPRSKIQI